MASISCCTVDHYAQCENLLLLDRKTHRLSSLEWIDKILCGSLLRLCDVRQHQPEVCRAGNRLWQRQVFQRPYHPSADCHCTDVDIHSSFLLVQEKFVGRTQFQKEVRFTPWGLHHWQRKQVVGRCNDGPVHGQESPLCGICSWNERDALISAWSDPNDHLVHIGPTLEFPDVLIALEKDHRDHERTDVVSSYLLRTPIFRPGFQSWRPIQYWVCLHQLHQHQHCCITRPHYVQFYHHL